MRLNIDGLRKRLLGLEEKRLTDFVEIACYVFAADRSTSRGGDTFANMGKTWRRDFHLCIGVRDIEFWSASDTRDALVDALSFLSEDNWVFEFVPTIDGEMLQSAFNFSDRDADSAGGTSIVLFSGGLDSLAGAVHELRTTNRHVVLLSHRNVPVMAGRQNELAKALMEAFPRRVTHASIMQGLANGEADRELTQRTRTFFFTAVAAVAAALEASDRIRFYENGIMSINLPISGQVVGTKASRSTHPRSLRLLEQLVGIVVGRPTTVDNPFVWKTKAEVVEELAATPLRPLIARTISCSRSRALETMKPHCGECAQCLQRRTSTVGGGAPDADPAIDYAVDFLLDARDDGPNRAMAVGTVANALDFVRMTDEEIATRFAGELSRVIQGFPGLKSEEIATTFVALFKRHGQTMLRIVSDAIKENSQRIALGHVPGDSLLRLLLDAGSIPHKQRSAKLVALPTEPALEPLAETDELELVIDEAARRVTVAGLAEFKGPMEFAVVMALATAFRKDREDERPASAFRCLRAKELADEVDAPSEEAVRQTIRRIRHDIREAHKALVGADPGEGALIERTQGGYRLNPAVRLIARKAESRLEPRGVTRGSSGL